MEIQFCKAPRKNWNKKIIEYQLLLTFTPFLLSECCVTETPQSQLPLAFLYSFFFTTLPLQKGVNISLFTKTLILIVFRNLELHTWNLSFCLFLNFIHGVMNHICMLICMYMTLELKENPMLTLILLFLA